MNEYKCKLCNKEFDKYDSLRRHMSKLHKVKSDVFYVKFYLNDQWPLCACGCGEKTKWSRQSKNFREFSGVGHLNRIRNNWGHNKKAIEKSSETRRKQFATGERKVWCDGLTKETDERLIEFGKMVSKRYTPEVKIKYSERMSKMRRDGTIPTLYREKSSQWKGGISSIQQIARSDKRLYDGWKYPILIRDEFKCVKCQDKEDLHIHHDGEIFSEIIKKVMTIDDYDNIDNFEVKKQITDKVINYHIDNKISGITLCRKCHSEFHPSLNF